ncbi:MAG: ATP-binding protein [Geminicoccaceae bacterium]
MALDAIRARRSYQAWVANETIEDYSLRYAASSFRKWSPFVIANTALGGISFLALEAIGGAITISYGFSNAFPAILLVSLLIFLTSLPIAYYSSRYNIDMDLLTRGAGFGYIGSTVTSLIYACFTFIFFALEAAIMAQALFLYFGLPITLGYIVSSIVIIPIVFLGATMISRLQMVTQPLWIVLLVTPFVMILIKEPGVVSEWVAYAGTRSDASGFNYLSFGAATGVLSALFVQIGEQIDYLRFMPDKTKANRLRWWGAVISAGPGWIVIGGLKILAGSLLAVLVVNQGLAPGQAVEPIRMYVTAYEFVSADPWLVLSAATVFVLISQVKINVTNAYAGSLAWSNFYSRVTHYHPGRVVWLVFNILISLLLMLLGVFETLETVLAVYSMVAVAWIGAIFADLAVLKPLGISPSFIEFRRAHLYDVNPVGCGAMAMASVVSVAAFAGLFGETAQAYAAGLSLMTAFFGAIAIGLATKGRYYIARHDTFSAQLAPGGTVTCAICTYPYESKDMAYCPFYHGPICSLCCSLDAHCHDICKRSAKAESEHGDQLDSGMYRHLLPPRIGQRLAKFGGVFLVLAVIVAAVFLLAYRMVEIDPTFVPGDSAELLIELYLASLVLICMAAWWIVLSHESREHAERELVTSLEELSDTRQKLSESERRRSLVGSMQKLSACADLRALSRCLLEEAITLTSAAGGEVSLESGDRIVFEQDGKRPDVASMASLDFPMLDSKGVVIGTLSLRAESGDPIEDEASELAHILVSYASEAVTLLQALDRVSWNELRLRDIIDHSPSLISLQDLAGRFLIVNKRFEEWHGVTITHAVGRTAHDLLQSDSETLYLGPDEPLIDSDTLRDREIEMQLTDGKIHTLLTTRFPVRAGDGGLIGVGTIATDISQRRQAEDHLRQTQKLEALGRLTGGIAHDFNNLLAVIGGNLSLIARSMDGDVELREIVDDAEAATKAGADLTHRLLAFGRQHALHPQPTDLGELITSFSRVLERALGEAVQIELSLEAELWPVYVDRGHVETSILNLALNGRDAMEEGGLLLIRVSNERSEEGDVVEIVVVDEGTGMTAVVLAQAVQPFFTTKGPDGGSGLGLSMVYGFAEQSGGHLDIASEPGRGTTVRLRLPRHHAEHSEAMPPVAIGNMADAQNISILLVEDQDAVRRLARRILSREGYRISEAGDAETALDILAGGNRVDLLLTDIILPGGMSGIELARTARAAHPKLKLLYASGYASDQLAETEAADELDAPLLRKPFQPDELLVLVRQAISEGRSAALPDRSHR